MNFSLLREQYMQDNPGFVLPQMVNSISELKSSVSDWLERYAHRQPKVVPADGDPPLFYFGFRAFYIDDDGREVSYTVAVPVEKAQDRVFFANGVMHDAIMDLRDHFDKVTTYETKYKKAYIPVKDDGTVDLPPGKIIE